MSFSADRLPADAVIVSASHPALQRKKILTIADIPPLIATSVVRGSEQGQSHGGVYLISPAHRSVHQVIDWNTTDIDWSGRGWDRGLRGIAFHNDNVYIAASDEVFVYDPQFRKLGSYRNHYLKHCHEICAHRGVLYLTSTGFDSILAFDLDAGRFTWGMVVTLVDDRWEAHRFDPNGDSGPPARNRAHINTIDCTDRGLSFSGLRTNGIVTLGSEMRLIRQVELPAGTHNARLTDDGVLFNDTAANFLRFVRRDGSERRFPFPTYPEDELEHASSDASGIARQGFGRGLCVIDDRLVAAGSSPSTVSVFDLGTGDSVFAVNFSMDVRNAIHGLEVWPYALPSKAPRERHASVDRA